ncbi:potassium voltage-gated channel subfamily KQT member 1-like [Nilaparvata lugens]|uniref:potassium voltage-gated channel subfamily KQT member 1-like n=1 Tax=Nilaparvata lugens TaxID=108931 RepID=UPI00193DD053|nr:potassium voltage-gated channel subfamily KQT member 1-like [Nilaparvata lugens]
MKQDGELMQMEESQQLLSAPCLLNKGEITPRSQLSVTILDIAHTPDTEVAETPTQRRESNNSVSDNYAQNSGGVPGLDPRSLLQERTWESRYLGKEHRRAGATFQGQVYNFLERPSGWKCFIYHCTVVSGERRKIVNDGSSFVN